MHHLLRGVRPRLLGGNEPKVSCFLKTGWMLLPRWEARRRRIPDVCFRLWGVTARCTPGWSVVVLPCT